MITKEQAELFAQEWIESWNSHDLNLILSHYEDDFEMSSPVIVKTMGEPGGKLKGKMKIREYWTKALASYPNLKFTLQKVLVGANSITIIYLGVRGLSAEVFIIGASGKVSQAFAHYEI